MTSFAIQNAAPARLRLFLVLTLFVLSQAFGLAHLSEHAAHGGNDHCGICDTVSHFGDGALPATVATLLPPLPQQQALQAAEAQALSEARASYTSRAPPHNS